jgi:CheY-like chemotaxis protein
MGVTTPTPKPGQLILVIDDDFILRKQVATELERRGYLVVSAASGAEGLDLLEHVAPRLIVLDYSMPGLDGASFLREITAWLPRCPPILLLTTAEDDPRVLREIGAAIQVEKPLELTRFLLLVDSMVRGGPDGAASGSPPPVRRAMTERRAHVRRRLSFPVLLRRADGAGPVPAETLDWSLGGVALALALETTPRPGSYLSVTTELPGGRFVELDARVRYFVSGRIGAQFFGVDRTRRLALETILESP